MARQPNRRRGESANGPSIERRNSLPNWALAQRTRRLNHARRRFLQRRTPVTQNCRPTLPVARHPLEPNQSYRHRLGDCNVLCQACGALHWIEERRYNSSQLRPQFFTCCGHGQVSLPSLQPFPEPLKSLLSDLSPGNIILTSWFPL